MKENTWINPGNGTEYLVTEMECCCLCKHYQAADYSGGTCTADATEEEKQVSITDWCGFFNKNILGKD